MAALLGPDQRLIGNILQNPKLTPATLAMYLDPSWIPTNYLMYTSARIATKLSEGNARLILSVPPRHGKSRLSSIGTSVWALDRWPQYNVAITSYGADLSEDFSAKVRDQIMQNPDKLAVRIRKDASRIDRWKTTKGGGMIAIGVGGPFTGRGANIIFVDDFIKDYKEAMSKTTREAIWNWFTSVVFTRLEPGGSIIIVATRWEEDDLIGRLLRTQGENWEYIRFPALAEPGDILGRAPGEALFPERYSADWLLGQKTLLGTKQFDALYQQDPRSASSKLTDKKWLRKTPTLPHYSRLRWVRVWDLAATADGGDYTCGTLCAVDDTYKVLYIAHIARDQMSPQKVEELVKKVAEADGPGVGVYIEQEPGASGVALIDHFRRNVIPKGYVVHAVPSTKKKVVRAQPMIAGAESGRVYLVEGDWNKVFEDEFDKFPTGDNDDQIDGAAIAWQELIGAETLPPSWGVEVQEALHKELGSKHTLSVAQIEAAIPRRSLIVGKYDPAGDPTGKSRSNRMVTGASWGRPVKRPQQDSSPPKHGLVFASTR